MMNSDHSTWEFAIEQAGKYNVTTKKTTNTYSSNGTQFNETYDEGQETNIPVGVLEALITQGQSLVVGSLCGNTKPSALSYIKTPKFSARY